MTSGGTLLSGFSRSGHWPILALITRVVDLLDCEEDEAGSPEKSKHRAGGASVLPELLVLLSVLPASYRGIGSLELELQPW